MAIPGRSKGYNIALRAAVSKAQHLLEQCEIRTLPVDLARLARHQGIHLIKELDTRLDGQLLELETGGYEVVLSKNAPLSRKRFTLAHEIAHTLLASEGSDELACSDGGVEELCNAMAAELLIPSHFLQAIFPTGKDIKVQSFQKATSLFECSLEAAGWRLLNSGLIQGGLLIWRITRDGKQGLELVAMPQTWGFQMPLKIGLLVSTGDALWQALMNDQSGVVEIKDPLSAQSHSGEYIKLNKTILVLVRMGSSVRNLKIDRSIPLEGVQTQVKLPF